MRTVIKICYREAQKLRRRLTGTCMWRRQREQSRQMFKMRSPEYGGKGEKGTVGSHAV